MYNQRVVNIIKRSYFVAIVIFIFYHSLFSQTLLKYGDCIEATITLKSEIDSYTFTGNAGDIVTVRMDASGIDPQIELYDPIGTMIKKEWAYYSTRIDTFRLANNGTYTILAMDNDGQQTGNYALYLQRTFNPGQSKTITYGQTQQDTIYKRAEMNAYTFAGNAGDVITVRMDASGIDPQIELYDPIGTMIKKEWAYYSTRIDTFRLANNGIYTIFAMDNDGQQTGNYALYLQRTFNPGQSKIITYGQTQQDTIYKRAEMNAYTFVGNAGDIVTVRMDASGIDPQIELYDPIGTMIKKEWAYYSTRIDTFRLANNGAYTILAMDNDGQQTGNYALTIIGITTVVIDTETGTQIKVFQLFQNYPNPFNPSTKINYSIPHLSYVTLKVYDMLGKEITTLVNEEKPVGNYEIEFDGSKYASGIYFYRIQAGSFTETKKLILMK